MPSNKLHAFVYIRQSFPHHFLVCERCSEHEYLSKLSKEIPNSRSTIYAVDEQRPSSSVLGRSEAELFQIVKVPFDSLVHSLEIEKRILAWLLAESEPKQVNSHCPELLDIARARFVRIPNGVVVHVLTYPVLNNGICFAE